MSLLLGVILAGAAVGAGAYLLVRVLVPGVPALGKALERLDSEPVPVLVLPDGAPMSQRVGTRLARGLGTRTHALVLVSDTDLAILDKPRSELLGEKAICAIIAFLMGPVITVILTAGGVPVSLLLPGIVSLALAGLAWIYPDLAAREQAAKSRYEFAAAATAYLELVAIARVAGDAANEAMVRAAKISGNATFRRISQALQQSTWAGTAPWDAVLELRTSLDVPELGDIADIMRLTGGGGQVIDSLRQRARALRDSQLAAEQARAVQRSERLTAAATLTGVVFILMLLYPAAANML
ncbi:hypothetical protein OCAE111667_09215 [Occultella aeris]|uniref:Type II secretion system protein GspF domain-containing protein n=1 Tax=Occultella aeris TaxID=2761496 RepID=A0A7M4DJT8_9MICO|nr:hypothetical protein [Occultella aeris]VZO37323.1 hypothetical protein HALOF300_02396 [Occultella aeris]